MVLTSRASPSSLLLCTLHSKRVARQQAGGTVALCAMARMNNRPSYASTAASSRYPSATPMPEHSSDQENRDPDMSARDKAKDRAADAGETRRSSLPTPVSDGSDSRGQKRKLVQIEVAQDDSENEDEAEARFNKYFDPNEDPEVRRDIKRKSRALERDFQGACSLLSEWQRY